MRSIIRDLVAGAAGVTALNAVTYLDMAVRARAASTTPETSVRRLANRVGVDLGQGEEADNRVAGLGPLLGIGTGLGAAVAFGRVAPSGVRWPVAAASLALLAMAGSNAPMTALGITDPRKWSAGDWAADVVPHLAYGAAGAAAFNLAD